jgi:hypothetical protein
VTAGGEMELDMEQCRMIKVYAHFRKTGTEALYII